MIMSWSAQHSLYDYDDDNDHDDMWYVDDSIIDCG